MEKLIYYLFYCFCILKLYFNYLICDLYNGVIKRRVFKYIIILVVPAGVPTVTVDREGLEHGKPLVIDCYSPASSPAVNITFYVNDEKVSSILSFSVNLFINSIINFIF